MLRAARTRDNHAPALVLGELPVALAISSGGWFILLCCGGFFVLFCFNLCFFFFNSDLKKSVDKAVPISQGQAPVSATRTLANQAALQDPASQGSLSEHRSFQT